MSIEQDPRRLAAFHEAGHAVVAVISHCELGSVSVEAGGHCRFKAPDVPPGRARRSDALQRHIAGLAAEAISLGLAISFAEAEGRCTGARTDCAAARARAGPGDDLELTWRGTIAKLTSSWPSVEALAAELLTAGTVDGARARRIIEAAAAPAQHEGEWEDVPEPRWESLPWPR